MPNKNIIVTEYRHYDPPPHFPVLLLSGEHWRISDVPSSRLHFHNCLELGVCHDCGGIMKFHDKEITFQAGDITCIPKNILHTTYSHSGTSSRWSYLFFKPKEFFQNLLPDTWPNYDLEPVNSFNYEYVLSSSEYPELNSLILHVISELEQQRPGYQIISRGLLLALYIELYRVQYTNNNHQAESDIDVPEENPLKISPALDYVAENYMHNFPIDHLADLCHWSPSHFRRVFQEIVGMAPLEYLNCVRIMKACNLIRNTNDSILTIAENVGFQSISSFNRNFLNIVQISPRDYRKQLIEANRHLENLSVLESTGWMYPE